MKWGLAVSCLALLAVPHLADATPFTIDYTGTKESQGIGGDTLTGSFTIDLSLAASVQQNPVSNSATYTFGTTGATFARPRRNETKPCSVARFPQFPTKGLAPVSPLKPWHA